MIAKSAIRRYLNQPVDDWNWLKELTTSDLHEEFATWSHVPQFKTDPYLHQLACFWLGIKFPRFFYLVDMGLGKSKIVLDVLSYRRAEWRRMLIVTHNDAAVENWRQQILEHSSLSSIELIGSGQYRRALLEQDSEICTVSYPGLRAMLTTTGKDGRGKRVIEKSFCKEIYKQFDAIVLDESHNCMNKTSLNWRLVNGIVQRSKFVYCLTGTPFGRDPSVIVPQYEFVDPDLFGTLGLYRAAFCNEIRRPIGKGRMVSEYRFDYRKQRAFYRKVKHRSIWYDEGECFDLPPIYRIPRITALSATQAQTLDRIRKQVRAGDLDGSRFYFMARGITAGYLKAEDEDGPILQTFEQCPKLDDLESVVLGFASNEKFIVFYEYTDTGRAICTRLAKLKIKYAWLWGGTLNPAEILKQFQSNTGPQALVSNSKSGSTSLNLQVANRVLFFESPSSPIVREQAERRVRPRLQARVFVYDFQAAGTLDQTVLEYVREGKDLKESILSGKTSVLDVL